MKIINFNFDLLVELMFVSIKKKKMTKIHLKLLIFSIFISSIKCHFKNNLNKLFWNQVNDYQKVIESWNKLNNQTIDLDLLTMGLSSKLENLLNTTSNISSKCSKSLINLKNDAKQMKLWAIKGKLKKIKCN